MIKVGYQDKIRKLAYVSVIIPAYNAEYYIGQAVESVLRQSYGEMIEIIVINDCSTDGTDSVVRGMIQEYQRTDCRNRKICYINNEANVGVAESRNCGVRMPVLLCSC